MIVRTLCSAVVLLLAFNGAAAAQQTTAPAMLANACNACHGIDGKGAANSNMPAINGKAAQLMSTTLKAFKTDAVTVTVMNRIAKGYTDAELDAIATHFAAIR